VNVRPVTLGPGDATNVSIAQGLKPGETVVVDGADKLKEGAQVLVRQSTASGVSGSVKGQGRSRGQGQSGQRHPS
jgi:multidrug efflux system membrane fusion protein